MALTARQIAKDLIVHLGDDRSLSATSPFTNLPTGCEDYLVNTLNAAMEEMRTENPGIFRRTIGLVFEEPKSGTVSVTNGSRDLYLGTLEEPLANGQTIRIDGDGIYNELRYEENEAGRYTLLHPYGGTTGVQNATIWGDSATTDATVDTILGGALLSDRRPLNVVNNRMDMLRWRTQGIGDYGIRGHNRTPRERCPGLPEVIWIEPSTQPDAESIETRIRCGPMPDAQYEVELEVLTIPTEVTAEDLNEGADFVFPVPGERHHTIFRAIALYRWSGSPWFAAKEEVQRRIDRDYARALESLKAWTPHAESGCQIEIRGL